MIKSYLLFLYLILSLTLTSQNDNTKIIEETEKIKVLYNQKKFIDIYALCSPEFKNVIKEKDFFNFLNNNVFTPYSNMERNEYLNKEKDYHTFISHFKNGDLLMNININTLNQIEFLQFLPHQSMPVFKVLNYLYDNKKQTALDSLIDKTVTDYIQSPQNCGLSIGIFDNGKEYFYNYGEVKRNSKTLSTQNTIYEIGSLSKTFCGLLLAKAIEEKKVKATDDIRFYLPKEKYVNLAAGDKFIQLIHLSNHTSGLPRLPEDLREQPDYDSLNPYKNYNKQMVFNYLKKVRLISEPGKIMEYSNLGMALLGIILEQIYSKSFEDLVLEKICRPNNMNNTAIKLTDEQEKYLCTGYNSQGNETPYWNMGDLAAAGGIKSSAKDMLIYLKKNIEEQDEATKISHQSTLNKSNNIAMAWHILTTKQDNKLFWHNGGTFGFSNFCGFIKEKNCAIIVLSNSGMPVDALALKILKYLQQPKP